MAAEPIPEIIDAAVTIAKERSKLLGQIRDLLKDSKERDAIKLMRQYCGLDNDKKGDRVN